MRLLLLKNAAVLATVRRARDLPHVSWPGLVFSISGVRQPPLWSHGVLGKLIRVDAVYHFSEGNHAAMVEAIRDLFAYATAIKGQSSHIPILVAWEFEWMSLMLMENTMAQWRIGMHEESSDQIVAASRGQIDELIQWLLNDERPVRLLLRALCGERTSLVTDAPSAGAPGAISGFGANSSPFSLWRNCAGPLFPLDVVHASRELASFGDAVRERLWVAARERPLQPADPRSQFALISRPISEYAYPFFFDGWFRLLQNHFRMRALRRMAGVALAIQLYERQHDRRPDRLDQLIPDFLTAIPVDPFSADGRPIKYSRDGGRDRVYSVGSNGVDDGGSSYIIKFDRGGSVFPDLVFYLDGLLANENRFVGDWGVYKTLDDHQDSEDEGEDAGDEDDGQDQPENR